MDKKKNNNTKTLVIASMLTALIFLSTYFVKFPVPKAPGAYVNIGDSVIYIASMMLGVPWAAGASAIGSMLADIMYGGSWYIPATFVIKGLMGLVASFLLHKRKANKQEANQPLGKKKDWDFLKFIFVCILCGSIMVAGYFFFEWAMFGWGYVLGTVVFNLIQWAAGVLIAAALYYPVKMIKAAI